MVTFYAGWAETNDRLRQLEYGISELRTEVRRQNDELAQIREQLRRANDAWNEMKEVHNEQSSEDYRERGLCGRADPLQISSD